MRFLVTGHTGFKGSWLVVMLKALGQEVVGVSKPMPESSYYKSGNFSSLVTHEDSFDIASGDLFSRFLRETSPDCVIHLAAEALVRRAQDNPVSALASNVVGTAKVLQAIAEMGSRPIVVVATTDKVYKESDSPDHRNIETDPLLGSEVYSHSKVAADVMAQSYMHALGAMNWAVVRAGNVIGGGDLSPDRLLPDIIRSHFQSTEPLTIRNPHAVRPWQHVLDCLWGYVSVVRYLEKSPGSATWNFGPNSRDIASVTEVVKIANDIIPGLKVDIQTGTSLSHHEAKYLSLDSSKARDTLGWEPAYSLRESISKTIEWEQRLAEGESALHVTQRQVEDFLEIVGRR